MSRHKGLESSDSGEHHSIRDRRGQKTGMKSPVTAGLLCRERCVAPQCVSEQNASLARLEGKFLLRGAGSSQSSHRISLYMGKLWEGRGPGQIVTNSPSIDRKCKHNQEHLQLVDAAVVEADLGADEHLTGLLGVEPQLDTGPI